MKKLKKLGKKCAHLGIDIDAIISGGTPALAETNEEEAAGSSKSKKRKNEKLASDQKKSKKQPKLEDLLGNTLQDDSEDEDFIAMKGDLEESNEEEQSSDEESYGFLKDVDDAEDSDEDNDDDDDEDNDSAEEEIEMPVKKSKSKFSKSLKSSNIERFDQMLKRKPHTGGVQKLSKKPVKHSATVKPKNKMQLSQAKEFAKPLGSVKGKEAKVAKPLKKSKKVK